MRSSVARSDGKIVGRVEDGVFFTTRDREEDYFRVFAGYGIDRGVLDKLRFGGVGQICITETDASRKRNLWSSMDDWTLEGRPFDYDGDEQVILPEAAMRETEKW